MPNRNEHLRLGAVAGTGYSVVSSAIAGKNLSVGEVIGSLLSSTLASVLPDTLEPAVHPNHRSTCHSVAVLGVLLLIVLPKLEAQRCEQRELADRCWQQMRTSSPQFQPYWQQQAEWHEFLAGLVSGLLPGYLSHLIADSQTPKGLPAW